MDNASLKKLDEFLIARGGPFHTLQNQLGLLREESLWAGRRAAIFVGLAWGVPLLLALLDGQAWGPMTERPYLLDLGAWSRFFVATGVFLLTERYVELRLRWFLQEFGRAPILAPASFEHAATAVTQCLKYRDARLAEMICLLLAVVGALLSLASVMGSETSWWAYRKTEIGGGLTPAGWWAFLVSLPIFWFLLFRGLWRHFVWSLLLRKFARLKLRLTVAHPDGNGGLAFIGRYPNAYAIFMFGVSAVVASAVANHFLNDSLTVTAYGYIMAAWLAIVLALFAYPLSAFTRPLAELKAQTQRVAGAQATRFHRMAERKTFGSNIVNDDAEEVAANQDVADSSKQFDLARKLKVYLVKRDALIPLAAATLLPLVAAGATKLPYKEIFSVAKKLLLL
jgi:hypothetical protein